MFKQNLWIGQSKNERETGRERCFLHHPPASIQGWVEGTEEMWVVMGKKVTEAYHSNVDQDVFFKWFKLKLCANLKRPLVIMLDNAGYHKVPAISAAEWKIFAGRTFSNLLK